MPQYSAPSASRTSAVGVAGVLEAADAGRDGDPQAGAELDGGDRAARALDGGECLLLAGLGHEQRELVAAQAGEDVLGAGDVAQRGGDRGEHGVAALVAERVVDRLEVVDVEQGERERPLVAQRAGELLAQALVEGAVVGQARERIGGGLLDEDGVRLGVGHRQADELGEASSTRSASAGSDSGATEATEITPHSRPRTGTGVVSEQP